MGVPATHVMKAVALLLLPLAAARPDTGFTAFHPQATHSVHGSNVPVHHTHGAVHGVHHAAVQHAPPCTPRSPQQPCRRPPHCSCGSPRHFPPCCSSGPPFGSSPPRCPPRRSSCPPRCPPCRSSRPSFSTSGPPSCPRGPPRGRPCCPLSPSARRISPRSSTRGSRPCCGGQRCPRAPRGPPRSAPRSCSPQRGSPSSHSIPRPHEHCQKNDAFLKTSKLQPKTIYYALFKQ